MKKILVGLLLLGMAAGSVFAQDAPALKFSGDFKGGLTFYAFDDGKDSEAFMNAWNDDGALYGKITGAVDGGNWGLNLGMKFSPGKAEPDAVYLWGGWLENKIKATVGQIGSSWGTGGWLDKGTEDSAFRLEVLPISGLNLGFTLGERTFDNPKAVYDKDKKEYTSLLAKDFLQEFGIGVKYTSTLFDVAAGFRNNQEAQRTKHDYHQRAYLGFIIRPITGLVVDGAVMAAFLDEGFSDGGNIDIRFRPRFTIGIVTVGSGVQAALFQAKDSKIGWKIPIYFKADFTSVFAPAYVEIDANVKNNDWDVTVFGNLGGSDKLMTAEVPVKLGYIYSFSSTATVETFYKITPTIYIGNDPSRDPSFTHQITANFKYTF